MARVLCLGLVLVSGLAEAARPEPPSDEEVAALRRAYLLEQTIASLLDWADAERQRGRCQKADALYRQAFYRDEITPRQRYRAQIGYERCEDPNQPRRPHERLSPPEKPVAKKRRPPKARMARLIPSPEPEAIDDSDPNVGWKIAGYTTAGLTAIVVGVKLSSENPNGEDFALNTTSGMIGLGVALTGAFLWRGYSGVSMGPAVYGGGAGASASLSF